MLPERSSRAARWAVYLLLSVGTALVIALPDLPARPQASVAVTPPIEFPRVPSQPAPAPAALASLSAFIDETVPRLMREQHVVGAAVAFVSRGVVVVLRGYGQSRLDPPTPVDPARTVFRLGSVSKPFTSVAVLQLAEAGALDLQRDVRSYLPEIALPYGATAHQLLTHTAAVDEVFAGHFTRTPQALRPLAEHVRRSAWQSIAPAHAYSYSSANYALAGLLVERLSGMRYEDYMAARVFSPLTMTTTTARQEDELKPGVDLARGYAWDDGASRPVPYRFTETVPAGGISSTAADMSRFLLALLGDGAVEGARVLSPQWVTALFAPRFAADPRMPARGYGFLEWRTHDRLLLHHDGTLGDHTSTLLLSPADGWGVFVASSGVPGMSNHLLEPLLTHLYGPALPVPPPTPIAEGPDAAQRFAGSYRDMNHVRHDLSRIRALMPMVQSSVTVADDGSLRWRSRRWVRVAPLVFRAADSDDVIAFREDAQGAIAELHAWGGTFERVGWLEQPPFHLMVVAVSVLAFSWYAFRTIRRRTWSVEGRAARTSALCVAIINLAFVPWFAVRIRGLGDTTPLPLSDLALLLLPVASALVTVSLPSFAAAAWWHGWWSRRDRVGYTTVVLIGVAFVTFLNYWKLLGLRY